MINKNDLDIMIKIGNYLQDNDKIPTKEDIKEYLNIVEKETKIRERNSKSQQNYNKRNYEYYSAMKNFYSNRKRGNEEKAKYWFEIALKIKKKKEV